MKWLLCAAAACAGLLLAGCGAGATYPTFGNTAYRLEGQTTSAQGGAPVPTVIYRDGPMVRIETSLPQRGAATIVFDQATNAAYVLTPAAMPATPASAPATGAATPAAPAAEVAQTGVAVRIADTDLPELPEAPWAALGADGAQSTGACTVGGESGHRWQPKSDTGAAPRTACITEDGIVLDVRQGEAVLFEATNVQRGVQDPSLFGVPPNYQVVDPNGVVQDMGRTLDQLANFNSAPATAPAQP